MEEKPRSATVHALYYGLITGAAMIVYHLILYIANLYMNRALGFVSLVILVGFMIWGTLEYRKKYLNGFISYGKAFSTSFLIGLFAGILYAIYNFTYSEFINPNISQEILDQARQKLLEGSQQMTEEQMDQALAWTARFTSPVMIAVWGLISNTFFALILGLIAAIFLKKEDKTLTTNM